MLPVSEELAGAARQIVAQLRARGVAAEAPYGAPASARRSGRRRRGRARALIVGPEEWANGEVVVKELASGVETRVRADALT